MAIYHVDKASCDYYTVFSLTRQLGPDYKKEVLATFNSKTQEFDGAPVFFGYLKKLALSDGKYKLPETEATDDFVYVLVRIEEGLLDRVRVFRSEDRELADKIYDEYKSMSGEDDSVELTFHRIEKTPNLKGERTWNIWNMKEGDIKEIFERMGGVEALGVMYDELDLDVVADRFHDGITEILGCGYDWQAILKDAIRETIKSKMNEERLSGEAK